MGPAVVVIICDIGVLIRLTLSSDTNGTGDGRMFPHHPA